MESKDIDELRKKRNTLTLEVERVNEAISKLEANQRVENIKRVLALMNELGVSTSDLGKIPSKKGKLIDAVFRDPKTHETFSNRGSYGKRIQRLLDDGIPFEDIVIVKNRAGELKEKFLASNNTKRRP